MSFYRFTNDTMGGWDFGNTECVDDREKGRYNRDRQGERERQRERPRQIERDRETEREREREIEREREREVGR